MSLPSEKLEQMYLTIKALSQVALEAHGANTEATQNLEYQLDMLIETMTPYNPTVDQVNALRKLTGDGMTRCNKAIRMARGDQERAVELMMKGSV